ncbi:MAG: VWA domain-containing protein [Bacteroidetes bacterium]|nr:MAG: VWA domain-containing protein [Bacteroidota bacterium]
MTFTFLNPALLWGLLALAVPFIVHFFNLQRPRQVLFSNVAFVREVKKTVVRRVQFQQWLLLLLRLLAITFLVLAFANPVIVRENQEALAGNRSVAIVIDNSYSMGAGNEKGAYFPQAISLARNIIRAYTRQDEFVVMTTSDLRLNSNFAGQEEALEGLRAFSPRQNTRSHSELLEFRDALFARANHQTHELYFLSDFQYSTVLPDSGTVDLSTDSSLTIKYLPLARRPQSNVYVANHAIRSRILEAGKPVSLTMTLVNDGGNPVSDLSVRVLLEGQVVAINNTELPAGGTRDLDLTFTPNGSGWLGGYIELDDNPIDFDNRRYFSLYVPSEEKVLVVENQPSRNVNILYANLFSQFDATVIDARNLSAQRLDGYQSLVLVGLTSVSSGLSDQLQAYVEGGGSLLIFPGEGADLSSLNRYLRAAGVGSFDPVRSLPDGSPVSGVDLAHPVFAGMFASQRDDQRFDAPLAYRYYPLEVDNNHIQNRILSLENGAPILLETHRDEGLIYTFTLFPGDSWTDLHMKTLFSPLMFRLTQIMNQSPQVQSNQEIGAYTPKKIRTQKQALINLIDAEGRAFTPEQYVQGGYTTLNFERMELHEGVYTVEQEGEVLEKIAFNISDLESKLAYASPGDLASYLEARGLGRISVLEATPEAISDQIREEKEGMPLWKFCLWLALAALAAEILLLAWSQIRRR